MKTLREIAIGSKYEREIDYFFSGVKEDHIAGLIEDAHDLIYSLYGDEILREYAAINIAFYGSADCTAGCGDFDDTIINYLNKPFHDNAVEIAEVIEKCAAEYYRDEFIKEFDNYLELTAEPDEPKPRAFELVDQTMDIYEDHKYRNGGYAA